MLIFIRVYDLPPPDHPLGHQPTFRVNETPSPGPEPTPPLGHQLTPWVNYTPPPEFPSPFPGLSCMCFDPTICLDLKLSLQFRRVQKARQWRNYRKYGRVLWECVPASRDHRVSMDISYSTKHQYLYTYSSKGYDKGYARGT